ncbi:EAL domain-containing protein [Candidatus Electronema halotolerans]
MEICLNIPDELFPHLQRHRNRLAQILSLGLRELEAKPSGSFAGLTDVLEFLAGLPAEEEILRLRPSPQLQAQLEALLEKQRTDGLSPDEESEWRQYEYVEHLVRKAKLNAVKRRQACRE